MISKRTKNLEVQLQNISDFPGCLILYIRGEVRGKSANWLQKCVREYIERGFNKLIFDLTEYHSYPEDLIGCFLIFQKILRQTQGDLVIAEIDSKVFYVFQLLGFPYYFNYRKTSKDALSFFQQRGPFPKIFRCGKCAQWLEAPSPGFASCSICSSVFSLNDDGEILHGTAIDYNSKKN